MASIADFAIDFHILAAESGWKDSALQAVFLKDLSDINKDELAAQEETSHLEELVSLSICVDNHLRGRNRGRTINVPLRPYPLSVTSELDVGELGLYQRALPVSLLLLALGNPCN